MSTDVPLILPFLDSPGPRIRRDRRLIRVRTGVYAEQAVWDALEPWERHRQRILAHAAMVPNTVFSHESAAVLHGLPILGEPADVHVYAAERTRTRRVGSATLHTSVDPRELTTVDGLVVTSLVDTAIDLSRALPPAEGLAIWDAALRLGVRLEDLRDRWHTQANARGTRILSWLGDHADPASESIGESMSRAAIGWLGFAPPRLQLTVRSDGHDDRPDFVWPKERVAGEFDGLAKYALQDPDDPMSALRAEKTREDRLRRSFGGVARWGFAEVRDGYAIGDRLAAAGLRPIDPPDHRMLATLRLSGRRSRRP